ncbi:ATP-binding protein [Streptomyces sp. ISL-11]|uniref:ATP-binding protein n=1 Tax=Streptomyces sp. ISL-11 TaxID=2819174 RepID=UPI001BEBD792|nr:ATP-binding protein [Streptomyces sp. ISL-11]MBT2386896.1 ATP-binding protein [Streptomyces sp. ISL-11]
MRTATLDSPLTTTSSSEPAVTYRLAAPATPTTPRVARDFVTSALIASEQRPLIEDARLCVSDIVTNVVLHARVATLTVEVTAHDDGRVVVTVRDDDPRRLLWRRRPRADEEGGRGLLLVHRLSHGCGVTWVWDGLRLTGKEVWFELRDNGPHARDQ